MPRSRRSGRSLGFIRTLNYLAFMPLASRMPTYARLLWALLRDERIPASQKAVLGLAAGYVASPIDVVPDFVPFLGAVDDLVVVVLAIDVFLEGIPEELLDETLVELGIERRLLERDRAQVRRMVPRPIRRLAQRLPGAIEGVADVIRSSGIERRLRTWIMKEEGSA